LSPDDPPSGTTRGLPPELTALHNDLCTGTRIVTIIYKVVDANLWTSVSSDVPFRGAPVDMKDGFVHLSTGAQVRDTVKLHFRGVSDLLLVAIDSARLGDALRWEPSRGGDLFPHLYGPLHLSAVVDVRPLTLGADGVPLIPEDVR
jgi:uncharacterized protein (DUF952 family)